MLGAIGGARRGDGAGRGVAKVTERWGMEASEGTLGSEYKARHLDKKVQA